MSSDLTPAGDFPQLLQTLEKFEESTYFESNTLADATYERDSEFGSLHFPNRERLELQEWSTRQLCKKSGVPYGTFQKASGNLAKDMFSEFIKGVKDPLVKFNIKKYGKKDVLRGVLPTTYPDLRDSQVLASLAKINHPFIVQNAPWVDQQHPSIRRTRIVFPTFNKTINGDNLLLGLDIVSSELGATPLQINMLLFKVQCTNGAIATYNNRPYFYFDYTHDMMFDVGDVIEACMSRAGDDLSFLFERVEEAVNTPTNLEVAKEFLNEMVLKNLLQKGVAIKAAALLEADGAKNQWDIVNSITAAARGFRDLLRLRYEQAAGSVLGLNLVRKTPEDDYAARARDVITTTLVLPPPPANP